MLPLSRLRRPGALAAVTVALALLSGCGHSFDAPTRKPYAASDGLLANSGDLRLMNILVVAADGASEGVVIGAVSNRGDNEDRLTAIESPHGTVDLGGGLDLEPRATVTLGAGADAVPVTISDLDKEPGQAIELEFIFEQAPPVTVTTVIMTPTGDYEGVTPAASPTALTP